MSKWYELKQLCNPRQWKILPAKNLLSEGYPVYGANGIIGYYSEYTHEKETVLVTCRGATCGEVNICEPYSFVTGNAMALDDLNEEKILPKYLYYFLKYRGFQDAVSGSAQPQITRQNIGKIKIYVPEKRIQMHIVKMLDKNMEILHKRKTQYEMTQSLIKSLFLQIFGEPFKNPKSWQEKHLEDVSNFITYGITVRPKYVEKGIPIISAKEIRSGEINFNITPKIELDDFLKISNKCKPEKGDILFSKTGAIGNCVIVRTEQLFALTQNVARISVKKELVHPEWLLHYLRSDYIHQFVNSLAKGNSILDLQIQDMKKIPVYIPPMELQSYYVERLRKMENVKHKIQLNIEQLKSQHESILEKVFCTVS